MRSRTESDRIAQRPLELLGHVLRGWGIIWTVSSLHMPGEVDIWGIQHWAEELCSERALQPQDAQVLASKHITTLLTSIKQTLRQLRIWCRIQWVCH